MLSAPSRLGDVGFWLYSDTRSTWVVCFIADTRFSPKFHSISTWYVLECKFWLYFIIFNFSNEYNMTGYDFTNVHFDPVGGLGFNCFRRRQQSNWSQFKRCQFYFMSLLNCGKMFTKDYHERIVALTTVWAKRAMVSWSLKVKQSIE